MHPQTDARVQSVTESAMRWVLCFSYVCEAHISSSVMNVIRMIKLFGWEPRIAKQLNEKREAELVSIRRNRMLGMMNNLCK